MDDPKLVRVTSQKINSSWGTPQLLGIIVAVITVVITLILISIYKRSKTRKNGILLLGLCDAGKTLIFVRLIYKKFAYTHTSVKENIDDYIVRGVPLKIVDIPGHERLRAKYFDQFKTLARGMIFVIDSLTIHKDIKDVAEFLYNCLIDSSIASNSPPLLILCNKQSEATAKGSNIVKMLLEKEITILRSSKTRQLESIGKTQNNIFLGREDKDFEFSQLSPMKVDFAECSALIGEDEKSYNITELEEWLSTLT